MFYSRISVAVVLCTGEERQDEEASVFVGFVVLDLNNSVNSRCRH